MKIKLFIICFFSFSLQLMGQPIGKGSWMFTMDNRFSRVIDAGEFKRQTIFDFGVGYFLSSRFLLLTQVRSNKETYEVNNMQSSYTDFTVGLQGRYYVSNKEHKSLRYFLTAGLDVYGFSSSRGTFSSINFAKYLYDFGWGVDFEMEDGVVFSTQMVYQKTPLGEQLFTTTHNIGISSSIYFLLNFNKKEQYRFNDSFRKPGRIVIGGTNSEISRGWKSTLYNSDSDANINILKIGISPRAGYFIDNHFMLGVGIDVGHVKSEAVVEDFIVFTSGLEDTERIKFNGRQMFLGFSPFVRYYFGKQKVFFHPYVEFDMEFVHWSSYYKDDFLEEVDRHQGDLLGTSLTFGLDIRLTNNLVFEVGVEGRAIPKNKSDQINFRLENPGADFRDPSISFVFGLQYFLDNKN